MDPLLKTIIHKFFYLREGADIGQDGPIRLRSRAGKSIHYGMTYARVVAALSGRDVCFIFNDVEQWVEAPVFGFDAVNSVQVVIASNEQDVARAFERFKETAKDKNEENQLLKLAIMEIQGKVKVLGA